MGSYPSSPTVRPGSNEQRLLAASFAIATANASRISEIEAALSQVLRASRERETRLSAIEEKLAAYHKPTLEGAAASEDYLRGHLADRIRPIDSAQPETPTKDTLSEKFLRLRERWGQETAFTSSPRDLFLHSAYQQIIGLGPQAVPHVMSALRDDPGLWLWALHAMTGANPIPDDFDGGTQQVAEL